MPKLDRIPKQFYRDLDKWINQGCPLDNQYHWLPYQGICSAWRAWGRYHNRPAFSTDLEQVFIAAGLDAFTPFNPPKYRIPYWRESHKFTNPARLAWIKEHAK